MDTQPLVLPVTAPIAIAAPTHKPHPALVVLTIAYLGLVGFITLTSADTGTAVRESSTWIIRMLVRLPIGGTATQWEFALNIAMFVPLGILLTLVFGARFFWIAAITALALTFSIEGLQQFIPYRVPDPRDLAANGLGGVAGTMLGVALLTLRRASAGPARTR